MLPAVGRSIKLLAVNTLQRGTEQFAIPREAMKALHEFVPGCRQYA
jgi:hypothetical protein